MTTQHTAADRRTETPDESTGQLLWLVFAVLVAGSPHLLDLHPWVPVTVLAITGWRIIAALKRWRLPSIWIRAPLTLLGFLGVLFSYRQISGLGAGSALLLIMVSMKLLETRGHRDRAVVVFICYFLLFAAFLREQAIWSAGYLMAGVLITTAALYQTARVGTVVPAPRAMQMAFRLVLQALPLMLLLFFLFPRVPGPFWSLPTASGRATAGLTNEMTPGDITELARSNQVAFRVRFDDAAPAPAELYWRGPVLTNFNGRTWTMQAVEARSELLERAPAAGAAYDYELTLEPHRRRWLLALETPATWTARFATLSSAYQLVNTTPVDRRMSYRGRSYLGQSLPAPSNGYQRARMRIIPAGTNPRSAAFARDLRARSTDDRAYLNRIWMHFRQQAFYYTLTPPLLGTHSVDEFLFDTRRGFCGHFASAFALLARAAGIPARIVTGYQGGEKNPLGNYWIVRQSDAHAWVEVLLDDQWVRYDPTAAVAPERIEFGFDAAMDPRALSGSGLLGRHSILNRLALSWDAVNAGWNRWVLSFGPDAQATMMSFVGIRNPSSRYLVVAMAISITILLVIIGLLQRYFGHPRQDALQIGYQKLCARAARAGRARRPNEAPEEYCAALCILRPDLATDIRRLFESYVRLRYDGPVDTHRTREFGRAVRRFRPRSAPT
ncbi:MAG: DUF3488 domain-containing protein [Gammaproteobacteria bacterium]|nr:MAG: DUF3488 domain-containing protein [Gammaproteobacteria bacterium]